MKLALKTIAALGSLIAVTASQAATFELSFVASNFTTTFGTIPAPTDPVIGRLTFEASALGADITSLDSIDLTIAGHRYSLGEVGFETDPFPGDPSTYMFGGTIGGVNGGPLGVDDFTFVLAGATNYRSALMEYTVAAVQGTNWIAFNDSGRPASDIVVTISQVPEPSACLLMLMGLAVIHLSRSRSAGQFKNRWPLPTLPPSRRGG